MGQARRAVQEGPGLTQSTQSHAEIAEHGFLCGLCGRSEYVTGNYFSTLGVGAFGGRVLTPDDDTLSAPPVAVLSHHVWQGTYGSAQLYGVSFWDPFALSGAARALALCAFVATIIPAGRAASISPCAENRVGRHVLAAPAHAPLPQKSRNHENIQEFFVSRGFVRFVANARVMY